MIVRRNRDQKPPRMIVRRARGAVGERPRMVVKRDRGVVIGARRARELRRPKLPRVSLIPSKRLAWAAAVALLFGIAGYGAWWLYESPTFRVSHVKVTGNDRTSTDQIVRRTELLGASMFTMDLADAQEVLYSFPLIASVEVQRDWPNTVRIVVQERRAWGTWEQAGIRYTIDRTGVVLGTNPPPEGSPHIRSAEQTSLRIGDRVSYQAVDAAAEIYDRLPRQLGTTVAEVAYLTGTGVQVTTANGQSALLGDSSSIAYKLAVWAALSTEAANRGITYTTIDLRYGNRPVLY